METRSTPPSNKKKFLVGIILLGIVVAAGVGAYFFYQNQSDNQTSTPAVNTGKSDAEKKREAELLADPSKKTENQSDTPEQPPINSSTGKQDVIVIITSAGVYDGQVEARGFVSNTVEQNGKCTYIFTNASKTVRKESQSLPNPTSTTCESVKFSASELGSGNWEVSLAYTSDSSNGTSTPKQFVAP